MSQDESLQKRKANSNIATTIDYFGIEICYRSVFWRFQHFSGRLLKVLRIVTNIYDPHTKNPFERHRLLYLSLSLLNNVLIINKP